MEMEEKQNERERLGEGRWWKPHVWLALQDLAVYLGEMRNEERLLAVFIDKLILDCIQTDIGCVKHVKTKSNLKYKSEWVSEWLMETRQSILNKIPYWLQIVQTELLFLGKVIITQKYSSCALGNV